MSKTKTCPENIQKLKAILESGNNLVDYFLVIGVEPSLYLNENNLLDLSKDKNTNIKNLSKILKPKIITKFPQFDNNNDTIDEEIITYCFPKGFKPHYFDTGDRIREKIFSIILDNNLFSCDYPQKYLTCLLFYEKVSQYKALSDEILKIKNNFDENGNCLSDESIIFNSSNTLKFNIQSENNNFQSGISHLKYNSSTFNNLNINDTSSNLDSTFITENKTLRLSMQNIPQAYKMRYYYIPKCICIVSIHPYIKLFHDILYLIYKYSLSSQQIPIEKIITNLIIEVPIAPRGLYSIDYMLINKKITLKRTENNKLLLSQIDLRKFHKNIQLNIQLDIFKHILFGSKIIFFSKNINELCEIILSSLTLIFPFKYPFQVSSYLNKNNYNILESISPFIIGINEVYNSQFFIKNDISKEGMDLFIVDLDNNITELISDDEFPDFPLKLINNLEKEIKNIEKFLYENNDNNEQEEEQIEEFNKRYQEIYFYFFCELIKNYEEYLNMNYFKNTENDVVTSIETLFNCHQFVKSHASADMPFYNKFIFDSQLFADFIYKRMIPKNNQETIDILLVNDTLTKIKNRSKFFGKDPTDFSDSDEYNIDNTYAVPKPRELNENEKNYIKKNREKLSEKGQVIKIKTINQNDNITFKYTLFPELDFDIYFNNDNANEYCPPPNYSEEIERINIDAISKSSLGQDINHSLEMKNYLYLSWLEVWAFSFWYIDKKERHYRFNQMLDVLDKVKHQEMNILNLLFDSLNKNNENKMILKLYRKLLEMNINPSTFIYNIISGVIDKNQMKKLKDKKKSTEMKLNSDLDYKFKDYNIKDNRKRTFLSVEDYLEINTKLKFYFEFSCITCGEKINLLNVCENFADVKNDVLWVPCQCGEYNLPKIKVRFGSELFKDKKYKTSSVDEIVLHSPYNLKINIKDAIMNNYDKKLNILDFKIKFKPLFWDFIWYCKIHHLDYNIILPYLKDIEELKRLNYKNPSNDIFEVIYEDKLYKENLRKISKYSSCIYDNLVNIQNKRNNSENFIIEQKISLKFIGNVKLEVKSKNVDINEDVDNENDKEEEKNNIIEEKLENNNINNEDYNKQEKEKNEKNEIKHLKIDENEKIEEKSEEEEIEEKEKSEENRIKEENDIEKEKIIKEEEKNIKTENNEEKISEIKEKNYKNENENENINENKEKENENINKNIYENEENKNNIINDDINRSDKGDNLNCSEEKDKNNQNENISFLNVFKNKIKEDSNVISIEKKISCGSNLSRNSNKKNIDPNIDFED